MVWPRGGQKREAESSPSYPQQGLRPAALQGPPTARKPPAASQETVPGGPQMAPHAGDCFGCHTTGLTASQAGRAQALLS